MSLRVLGGALGSVMLGGGTAPLEWPCRPLLRACDLLVGVGGLPVAERGVSLRHAWFGDLGADEFELLFRRLVGVSRLFALRLLSGLQFVQGIARLLPSCGTGFGVFCAPFEGGYLAAHELHRAIINQRPHRFRCLLGGISEATVCVVAFHLFSQDTWGRCRTRADDLFRVKALRTRIPVSGPRGVTQASESALGVVLG